MSTENIVKNRYYRILKDKTEHIWNRISYWTHADDVELNNGTTLSTDLAAKETTINNLFEDFAPIERASTASQAYTRGQCLIYNNQFYRVIAAIAIGNELVVGTNIQVMSASELSSMLTATNGSEFYFDYQDNKYGFKTSPTGGAETFIPFRGGSVHTETREFSIGLPSGGGTKNWTDVDVSLEGYQFIGAGITSTSIYWDWHRSGTYTLTYDTENSTISVRLSIGASYNPADSLPMSCTVTLFYL